MDKYQKIQQIYESKLLNEGYEKIVLGLLEDEGIQAEFSYGTLYVDEKDEKKAIKILKDNMRLPAGQRDIYNMPKIEVRVK